MRDQTRGRMAPTDSHDTRKRFIPPGPAVTYLPDDSGAHRETLELAMVREGLASSYTAAKTKLRDFPAFAARLAKLANDTAPHRMGTLFGGVERFFLGCDSAEAGPALNLEEATLDGQEDIRYEAYRNAPAGSPERERLARESARADRANALVLMRRAGATLRAEGL